MSPRTMLKDAHQEGWRYAIHRFYQRRHIPLVAFLMLASFTGYSFKLERDHSNNNRHELATQTRTVLINGCERGNDLRHQLQKIIISGIPQTRQYVKDGTITQAQADRAIANARIAIKTVAPIDCAKQYPVPKG